MRNGVESTLHDDDSDIEESNFPIWDCPVSNLVGAVWAKRRRERELSLLIA